MKNKGAARIGTNMLQANDMNAVCTEYRFSTDITIRLDNGNLVRTTWKSFITGSLHATDDQRKECRIGQTKMQNCGESLTCIAYRGANDCDFQFNDGKVVKNRRWGEFIRGSIAYTKQDDELLKRRKERIGKTVRQNCGLNLTCIAYRNAEDCDFQFEDGRIIKNRKWGQFIKGEISRFDLKTRKTIRVGHKQIQKCGLEAVCIAYRTSKDCDFRYSDGHIVKNISWRTFLKGGLPYTQNRDNENLRIGQKRMQNCGKTVTCTAYRGARDCDFMFDDGKALEHRSWVEFMRRALRYNTREEEAVLRVGKSGMQNCGLPAVCIAYRSALDADYEFPDGAVNTHRTWRAFVNGEIAHPLFTSKIGSSDFYGYTVVKGFTDNTGKVYYRCTENKTGERSLRTLEELIPKVNNPVP